MTVKRVVGDRRLPVLADEPHRGGVDTQALPAVRMELSLRKGRAVVITVDGLLTVQRTIEDQTDSLVLVMGIGRSDGPSGSGSSADRGEAHPQANPQVDVWA